tara:strand:+ start:177 stop:869 length:693 start_codon:yes stop_codon:yes gene_type:complete
MAYFTGPNIVQDGLTAVLDAGSARSYPGSGTTWYNLSSSGNGTLNNASMGTTTAGTITFDGVDDNVVVSSASDFFTNAWTYEVVAKFGNNIGTYQGLVWAEGTTGVGGSGLQYLLALASFNKFHYRIYNATTGWGLTEFSTSMVPTDYNHIVWQFNNGTSKIYLNGQLLNTDTSRGAYNGLTNQPLCIGSRNDLNYEMNGDIPVVNFYNRELTAAEVLQNYNAKKLRFGL